ASPECPQEIYAWPGSAESSKKYSAGIPQFPSQAERRKNANGRLLYKIKNNQYDRPTNAKG
ncbi:MAG: hypothetical protein KDI43_15460, partial [Gammaproteobacteria bacterium]|nr:hypothetical protein [Gammaproteobacteria bacterium]